MVLDIVAHDIELALIHEAVCRARRAGLLCSICFDLAARVARKD